MVKIRVRTSSLSQSFVFASLAGAALVGCGAPSGAEPATPQAPGATGAPATVMVEPPPAAAPAAMATGTPVAAPAPEPPVFVKDAGFKTPESVLYDPEQDVYLLSNIDGKPVDADGNGFISKVGPDGKVIDLKWIDGTKKGNGLNAPKGLAVAGNTLYVADLTFVRMFDRKTGAPKGKFAAPGATFLNGIAAAPDGTVYVTDSGLKAGKEGLEPTNTDAIYKLGKNGKVEKLAATPELGRPNGIVADDQGVWVCTFGTGAIYHVGKDGKRDSEQKLPAGSLDGLVKLADGSLLVSSWAASSVFRGSPGGNFTAVITDTKSPAGIGYDSKRGVVLVPLFTLDGLQLSKLPGGAPQAPAAIAAPAAAPGTPAPAAVAPAKPAPAKAVAPVAAPAKPAPAASPVPAAALPPAPAAKPSPPAAAMPPSAGVAKPGPVGILPVSAPAAPKAAPPAPAPMTPPASKPAPGGTPPAAAPKK